MQQVSGIQFHNFSSKVQSRRGRRRRQIIFRKSFRNTLQVPKSPPTADPPKKISFPQVLPNRTLCCKYGGWGFSTSAPSCARRFRRSQNAPGSHKIGLGQSRTARAVKYRAPPAPATLLFRQRRCKVLYLHRQLSLRIFKRTF